METDYDALIVGASIEGLCVANYFALNGKKVAIVELMPIKKMGNEDKCALLSGKTIEILKEFYQIRIPSKFIENEFESFSIDFGGKREVIQS